MYAPIDFRKCIPISISAADFKVGILLKSIFVVYGNIVDVILKRRNKRQENVAEGMGGVSAE